MMNLTLRFWLLVLASALGFIFVLMLIVTGAKADCLSIRDYDRRQACLAEQRQSPEGCTSIRDCDQRERCRQRAGQRDLFGQPVSRDRWPAR
jgi:hypothetical protein